MNHSPLPWRFYYEVFRAELSDKKIIEVQDKNGRSIVPWIGFDAANQSKKGKLANAAYIVRACNCHEELLEALKDATNQLECSGYCYDHPALTSLRAAIRKAEGGQP